ncbi:MAG: siderophore-interacting protein [Propionibacteriaceae bacterium]|jgi:ATP-binding cassette subfamily B protein IrtA|nr:siderophore-interacting protein [Propionibacteriaceae bacterium]
MTQPAGSSPRLIDHPVTVERVHDLTAWYRRIDFVTVGLLSRLSLAPAAYLMIALPGAAGGRPVQRAYTIVSPRPAGAGGAGQAGGGTDLAGVSEAGQADGGPDLAEGGGPDLAAGDGLDRFSLEFVLHQPAGPASAWASQARLGDVIRVSDPPYHFALPQPLGRAWLLADSSAAPALRSILDHLPQAVEARAVLVDPHPDRQLIWDQTRPGPTVAWLSQLTAADLAGWAIDPVRDWLWAAGQRDLVKTVRGLARGPWGLPRDRQHLQTYWIAA